MFFSTKFAMCNKLQLVITIESSVWKSLKWNTSAPDQQQLDEYEEVTYVT
jgi:hypothetical protein